MRLRQQRNKPTNQSPSRRVISILIMVACTIWIALTILFLIVRHFIPGGIVVTFGGQDIQNLNLFVAANFFFIFGIMFILLFAAAGLVYKLHMMRGKIMFRSVGGHGVEGNPNLPWYDTIVAHATPHERSESTLHLGDALLFDPAAGLVRQGDGTCSFTVTNTSKENIVIDGKIVPPGGETQIRITVDANTQGRDRYIGEVEYRQGKKRFVEPVIVEYEVFLQGDSLGISFSKYIYRQGALVPVIQARNFTNQDITLDSGVVIPAAFEGEIELPDSVSETDQKNSQTFVSYDFEGKKHEIGVPLPGVRMYQMLAKGMMHTLLSYLTERRSSANADADADFRYQSGTIHEQLGELEAAETEYKAALEMDPHHARALHALRHLEKGRQVHGSYTSHIRDREHDPEEELFLLFPSELLPRYRPLRVLASDKFARIFLCIREDNGKERILKVFTSGAVDQGTFYLKVASWRPLHHPHILRLYAAEFSPVTFLEMEWAPGILYRGRNVTSLADVSYPIKADTARRIGIGILKGLIYFHDQGGRHFDLQPRFVLIGSRLVPKISGFVIFAQERRELIRSFSCPERVEPDIYGKPGTKCDIYSAGTILYTMLTGALWEYANPSKLPSAYAASLAPYDIVISRLLAPEKEHRCTAEEAIALLEKIS